MRGQGKHRTGYHPAGSVPELVYHKAEQRGEDDRRERQHRNHPSGCLGGNVKAWDKDGAGEFLEGDDCAVEEHAEQAEEPEVLVAEDFEHILQDEFIVVSALGLGGSVLRFGGSCSFLRVASQPCTGKCSGRSLCRLAVNCHENSPED